MTSYHNYKDNDSDPTNKHGQQLLQMLYTVYTRPTQLLAYESSTVTVRFSLYPVQNYVTAIYICLRL